MPPVVTILTRGVDLIEITEKKFTPCRIFVTGAVTRPYKGKGKRPRVPKVDVRVYCLGSEFPALWEDLRPGLAPSNGRSAGEMEMDDVQQ